MFFKKVWGNATPGALAPSHNRGSSRGSEFFGGKSSSSVLVPTDLRVTSGAVQLVSLLLQGIVDVTAWVSRNGSVALLCAPQVGNTLGCSLEAIRLVRSDVLATSSGLHQGMESWYAYALAFCHVERLSVTGW